MLRGAYFSSRGLRLMFIVLLLATDEQVAACCPVLQRVGIFVVLLHLFFLLFTLMFFREQCFLFLLLYL
jgi:hypothetical protein